MPEVLDVTITAGVPTAGDGTVPTLSKTNTVIGAVNETAPASDTASSGLNGRLQRIAQRLTSLIAATLATSAADGSHVTFGAKADAKSTATDTTAISAMSVFKQISASVQAPPSQAVTNAGTFPVQAAATLAAETTKVIGTVNISAAQTIAAVTAISNALPAGTNAIGKLAANSGVDIGDVDVLSVSPGVAATNLGKAEDAVHASGDVGVMVLGVRQDTQVDFGADGDYVCLSIDANGALRVAGGGGGTEYTEDAAAAADPVGQMLIAVRRDTLSISEVSADGDNIALKATNKGQLHVFATIDSSQVLATVAHDAVDSDNPLKTGGYAKAAAPTDVSADGDRVNAWFLRNGAQAAALTAAGALIGGDATNGLDVDVTRVTGGGVAHDGADSGNPIKVGARARTTDITAVSSDDRVDAVADKIGARLTRPYALPENSVSGAITSAMTGTTSTSLVAAPGAGLFNYITTIIVSNAHATVGTDVIIQDGSGGTTLLTIPAAPAYGGAVIQLPVPLKQPTANTALFCANVTTGASTKVSAVGYKGV